uniref:Uncharacterized protein n=1 Tax=Rhizophora mucronata TaxID=61149 RepID=A0A2P2PXH7_RHIMU
MKKRENSKLISVIDRHKNGCWQ